VTLAETQALFHATIMRADDDRSGDVQRCFTGSRELSAAERVEIYAEMYLWRIADALREDYPKLAALLGDERFFSLAEAYVREHPSRHHDLGQVGVHLPEFLGAHPDPVRPDLGELAALEWARGEVFVEEEMTPARGGELAALAASQFLEARLRLVPALRRLAVEHDVVGLWRALEDGQPVPPPVRRRQAIAVWRAGFEVFHSTLPLDEAVALESVASGEPLARVCEAFGGREDPARAAFDAISGWFDEGWIAAIRG
jgi:hypothetical protein